MKFNYEEFLILRRDHSELVNKVKEMIEEREKIISKNFDIDTKGVEVKINLYASLGKLKAKISLTLDSIQTFCACDILKKEVYLIHPASLKNLVEKDNYTNTYSALTDYFLYKLFLKEKYLTEKNSDLEKRQLVEVVSKILSGHYQSKILEYDVKRYNFEGFNPYQKKVISVIYVMLKNSSHKFVLDNLKDLFELSIEEFLDKVYKKNLKEFIGVYQAKLLEEEKKLRKVFRKR